MRKVFETYVGALFIRNGLPTIQPWISRLIDPNAPVVEETPASPPANAPRAYAPLPPSSSYSSASSRASNSVPMSSYQPAPPKSPPPPIPPPYMNTGPGGFHMPPPTMQAYSMVTVALMNQKASQMGYQVTYPAEHTGPPHNPIWTVRCCRTCACALRESRLY